MIIKRNKFQLSCCKTYISSNWRMKSMSYVKPQRMNLKMHPPNVVHFFNSVT